MHGVAKRRKINDHDGEWERTRKTRSFGVPCLTQASSEAAVRMSSGSWNEEEEEEEDKGGKRLRSAVVEVSFVRLVWGQDKEHTHTHTL